MKKAFLALLGLSTVVISCNEKTAPDPTPAADAYMTTSTNSKWTYDVITNPGPSQTAVIDTVTASGTDTSINTTGSARIYRILKHTQVTNGTNSDYYNRSGSDYYRYQSFTGLNTNVENIYLKDNATAGTSWSQNVNILYMGITVPLTITNSIANKGITKVVNGVTYTDVIDVQTTLSSSGLPPGSITSNIHSYYARKVGLIQGDYMVQVPAATININTQTLLKTAVIQ